MDWDRDRAQWPFPECARRVRSRPHRWHVQELGAGPDLLMIHGTGSSAHSWRGLFKPLSDTHRAIAIDLPGQGFSDLGTHARYRLDHVSEDIARLVAQEGWQPEIILAHSAGVAIALDLVRRLPKRPRAIIGINGALHDFTGTAGLVLPLMARTMALNPATAFLLAASATSDQSVRQIITSTGSELDDRGIWYYHQLMRSRGHVDATLTMLAQWSLEGLATQMPQIDVPVLLLSGDRDHAVPTHVAVEAAAVLPHGRAEILKGLGHLAHEEDPEGLLKRIGAFLAETGGKEAVPAGTV